MNRVAIRTARAAVGWIVAVAVLSWVARPLLGNFNSVRSQLGSPDGTTLLAAAACFVLYFGGRAFLWVRLRGLAEPGAEPRPTVRIWFLTEFARYLPGNVWSFLGRAGALRIEGVPVRTATRLLLREVGTVTAGASGVACIAVALASTTGISAFAIAGVAVGSAIIVLVPARAFHPVPPTRERIAMYGASLASWAAFGFGSAFALSAFGASPSLGTLLTISVVAWLAGYLSLVTPSGIGVREAVLVALLGTSATPETASALAILSRLVVTAVEVVLVLVVVATFPRSVAETSRPAVAQRSEP